MNVSAIEQTSIREQRVDQLVAILGSSIPVALVLGVVVYEFTVSLTGLVWLVSRVKYPVRRESVLGNLLFWPIVSWFLIVLTSRLINGGTAYQFGNDFAFIRFPLFFFAMLDTSGRIPVHRYLLKGLMAGMVYAGLNLLSAHLMGHDFIGKPLSRYIGKLNEGARIGGLCAYAAPLFLLWGLFDRDLHRRKRFWIITLGLIGGGLVVSSQVRTALLSTLVGLLGGSLSLLIIRKQLKTGLLLALLLLAGLGVGAVLWMAPSFESIYDRVYFWQVSWKVWLQNPITGVGISSFNEAYRQIAESGLVAPYVSPTGNIYQSVNPRHAHNLFLQLLACNGILGMGAFGWIFIRVVQIVRSNSCTWRMGLSSWPFICVAIGLTGWNIYDPFYTSVVFYFLALIGISVNMTTRIRSA